MTKVKNSFCAKPSCKICKKKKKKLLKKNIIPQCPCTSNCITPTSNCISKCLVGPKGSKGPPGPQGSSTLADLTDVALIDLGDYHQSLVYNADINKWTNRELCLPLGELWALGDGATTFQLDLTVPNQWFQINYPDTNLFTNDIRFPSSNWIQYSPGRLQYIHDDPNFAHCAFSLSSTTNNSSNNYQVSLFKNNTLVNGSVSFYKFSVTGDSISFAFHKALELIPNDIIDVRIRSITDEATIVFDNINIVLLTCCPT